MTGTAELHFSSLLSGRVSHGFTGRSGGVSSGPFTSLNLGMSTADDRAAVTENRARVFDRFGRTEGSLALLSQVHGDTIVPARAGEPLQEADAQHSADPELLLAVGWADCLPLLYFDPDSGAVAAAHCGWRGSLAGLAGKVVRELQRVYGSDPARLFVALGPGICQDCYQVGPELAAAFTDAGFADTALRPDPQLPGHVRLDLRAVNRQHLLDAGVDPACIDDTGLCTSCRPDNFFSHRRDRGTTGRHWALISAV